MTFLDNDCMISLFNLIQITLNLDHISDLVFAILIVEIEEREREREERRSI